MPKNKKIKIKQPQVDTSVEKRPMNEISIDYPVFCFRYFQKECLKSCSESQIKDFFDRLQRLGELGWHEINKGNRHDYGWEMCKHPNLTVLHVNSLSI